MGEDRICSKECMQVIGQGACEDQGIPSSNQQQQTQLTQDSCDEHAATFSLQFSCVLLPVISSSYLLGYPNFSPLKVNFIQHCHICGNWIELESRTILFHF